MMKLPGKHGLLPILAIASLLCGIGYVEPASALDVGDRLPALVVTTLDGKQVDLSALRGKVVVLDLWATWCEPCREEMPVLDAFYRQYQNRGVLVFGLSEDAVADLDAVRKVMTTFSYPAALARQAKVNKLRNPRVLPITYVIDQNGVVRAKLWVGGSSMTARNLAAAVVPLLPVAGSD
jgi:cytochrome c biogenesis protein CcmG, thiol:disulfide interchange protein DsbE